MTTSRRRRLALRIGLTAMAVLVLLQFRRPERSNPPVVSEIDAPPEIEAIEHNLRDIDEQVSSGEMPLPAYLWLHPEARLSDADRRRLVDWARTGL